MKKVLALIIALLMIIPNLTFFTFASESAESEYMGRTGANVWVNDWNSGTRSIKVDLQGNLKTDSYYNCFTKYFDIWVSSPDTYYSSPTDPYFYTKSKTDITPYLENGYLRFWVSVPKDMTVNIELMSNSNGAYGRSGIKKTLKVADNVDMYQEVQIPLKSFFGKEAYRNTCDATAVRYISIGGGSKATAETFLAEGEKLKVSFFEIWSGIAPTPEVVDLTPEYYSKSGKYYIKDLFAELDKTSVVTAFKDSLRKENYLDLVSEFNEYATLLDLYTVNILNTGSDYSVTDIKTHVKVYIPLTNEMKNSELAVATVKDGIITERDFFIEGDSLAVVTNQLGDILIMNTDTPKFVSNTVYYEQSAVTVKDNERINEAVLVKTPINSAKPTVITYEDINTAPKLEDLCDWIDSQEGTLRFWVKVPWQKNTPLQSYKLDLCIRYSNGTADAYPHTSAEFEVKANGMWQEIRIDSNDFSADSFKTVLNNETYLAGYKGLYCRVLSFDETDTTGFYFSKFNFHDISVKADTDNGNIERTAFVLDGKKQDYVSEVSVSSVTVENNRFVTDAKRITRKETTSDFGGKILLPYSQNISVTTGSKYNQIADWFYNDGAEIRVYMKNESDSPVSFKLGLYAKVVYNSSTAYPKAVTKDYIILPANSGWTEIRIKLSDTNISSQRIPEFTTTNGYVALEIYTKKDEFLQKTGDSVLVSPVELYSHNIVEGLVDGFESSYILAGVMEDEDQRETEYVEKTTADNSGLPFFSDTLNVSVNEEYFNREKPIYLFAQKPIIASDFKEWVKKPQAQMRFWVKCEGKRTFKLSLFAGGNSISADVSCNGDGKWQEIVLSRGDFTDSTVFNNTFDFADTRHLYMSVTFNDLNSENLNEIVFGKRVEFYSGLAYQKGDANKDNTVNLKDLVRTKILVSQQSDEFVICDIDSDGKLSATDLTYMRKRLISNSWS